MPDLDNDQIGLNDDVIEPHDNLSVTGITWEPLIATVDAFYDTMDALAPTFPSEAQFTSAVQTGFASAAAQINSSIEMNKNKPRKTHRNHIDFAQYAGRCSCLQPVPAGHQQWSHPCHSRLAC